MTFIPNPILCHKCPTPGARERNQMFSEASKRAGRCQINSTVLGMRPDSTEVGPGVGILGPGLSMGKREVGVGWERWRACPPRGAGKKVASQGKEAFCWRRFQQLVLSDRTEKPPAQPSAQMKQQCSGLWASLLAAAAEPCLRTTLIQSHPNSYLNQLG